MAQYGFANAGHGIHGYLSDLDGKQEPYQIRVHGAGLNPTLDETGPLALNVLAHNTHAILAQLPTAPFQKFIINLDLCPVVEIIEL